MTKKNKGFLGKLLDNLDMKLENKSQEKKCCCCKNSKDKKC